MNALSLYGHTTDPCSSYGIILLETARYLTRMGWYVNILVTDGVRERDEHDEELKAIMTHPIVPTLGGLLLAYPTSFDLYGPLAWSGPTVAVTTWESTELPPGWVDMLNGCEAISTPSSFSAEVFRNNGVHKPLVINPEGLNEAFTYQPRTADRPFTFLAFFDNPFFRRKGWDIAISAFIKAFGVSQAVRLLIKGRPVELENVNVESTANVEFIKADMNTADLVALYQRCDVMIAPTRAEGFGRLPREFARTGGVALATNWSGTADDIDHWGVPITDYGMAEAWRWHPTYKGLGQWAEVDADKLAEALKLVVEWPLEKRNAWGRKVSAWVGREYCWAGFARQISDLVMLAEWRRKRAA